MPRDRDENAAALRQHITKEAGQHQPGLVSVKVTGNADQETFGWVWGDHAGKAVRVIVGNGIDVSSGEHVLRCMPPDASRPGDPYYALGLDWNGLDDSRIPRMAYKGSDGGTVTGAHTHSEYAAASHTHTAGSITDLFNAVSGFVQPGTGMVFSYAGSVISVHNTATGGGAGGGSDESLVVGTAGVALARGERVYMDNAALWQKVDIDNTAPAIGKHRGVVANTTIASAATGDIQILGVSDDFTGLPTGSAVWAHTAAGGYTITKPTPLPGSGQVVIDPIGLALDASHVLLDHRSKVQFIKRESLANNGTATVVHYADPAGYTRRPAAYVATTTTGTELTSYADTNQDSNAGLLDKGVTGYGSDSCSGGTPSASSTYPGENITALFDDNIGTAWGTNNTTSGWVQYQFSSAITIAKYTIEAHTTYPGNAPKDWTFEASATGAWGGEEVVLDTQTGQAFSAGEQKDYTFTPSDTTYAYYRLVVTAITSGVRIYYREMEMMQPTTADGATGLAQGFQVSGAQTVGTVALWLKKVGSPTDDLTLTIETDSGGDPTGTPVTNGTSNTVATSDLSTSYGWISFTFATDPAIADSTQYHLVLTSDGSQSFNNYIHWGADGSSPGYTDGELKEDDSGWGSLTMDGCFYVYGPSPIYESPALVDRWGTALAVVAVRYDDGADANPETKTTFKNKIGTTIDLACVVELD